jgi:anaerobic nitric oxide reductase flavorubredoxin
VRKGIRNKKVLRFDSYGWAGGAQRECEKIIETAGWDLVDSLEFMGQPTKENLKRGEELGKKFAQIIQRA